MIWKYDQDWGKVLEKSLFHGDVSVNNYPMTKFLKSLSGSVFCALALSWQTSAVQAESGVKITKGDGRLAIEIDGALFSNYYFEGYSRPFLFPLVGPGGVEMTRSWPIKDGVPDEEKDHPHHKSFWWAHGDMNGVDFWAESPKSGKTVHEGFGEIVSGAEAGVIHSRNRYVAGDGKVICTDERVVTIRKEGENRIVDFEVKVVASHGDLVFGDTKEGTLALRLNEGLRLKGKIGKGRILNSEGVEDGATWGKRASWVDYFGPIGGKMVGVAILDHPSNPRYPTWWHVRDYGLFAANPFGIHDFEKKPKGAGDLKVESGKSVTFKYRIILHAGDSAEAAIQKASEAWAGAGK